MLKEARCNKILVGYSDRQTVRESLQWAWSDRDVTHWQQT